MCILGLLVSCFYPCHDTFAVQDINYKGFVPLLNGYSLILLERKVTTLYKYILWAERLQSLGYSD